MHQNQVALGPPLMMAARGEAEDTAGYQSVKNLPGLSGRIRDWSRLKSAASIQHSLR